MGKMLFNKFKESFLSICPIYAVVILLHVTGIATLGARTLREFFISGGILLVGMTLFNVGVESAMMPIGEKTSGVLLKKSKIYLLLILCFILGFVITLAEPDLNILATLISKVVPIWTTTIVVALGVGVFTLIAILRVFLKWKLKYIMILCYGLVFILACMCDGSFFPVAFDSGGITTGPVTVPFLMALGLGVTSITHTKQSKDDSFGMVSLCAVGPIIAMLILGTVMGKTSIDAVTSEPYTYWSLLSEYARSVLIAMSPIVIIFLVLQFRYIKMGKRQLGAIFIGLVLNYLGLVLFLSAVEYGFMSAGTEIGTILGAEALQSTGNKVILVAVGFVLGFLALIAEPTVHVLNKLVEETSGGVISRRTIYLALAIGVGCAVALSMLRIIFNINFVYIIGIGYAITMILTMIVDDVYVGIAYDSGTVSSGPMSGSFILPLAIGVASSMGADIMSGAFGVVALVTFTPLLVVEILGLIVKLKSHKRVQRYRDDTQIINF